MIQLEDGGLTLKEAPSTYQLPSYADSLIIKDLSHDLEPNDRHDGLDQ
jgi:hypothetical protein